MNLKPLFKAARADFLPASIIPFLIGTAHALNKGFSLSLPKLMLGLAGVTSAHLAANLSNDYFDYKSGADNQTEKQSSFFGGSRAIQEGIYTDKEIFRLSLLFLFLAFLSGVGIFIITGNPVFLLLIFAAGFLAVEYTAPPLRLAYNRLGEIVIFLLFGIMLVTGSFYLFSENFSLESFFISLPISFLITGVIVANEIPDFETDLKAGKNNLLSLFGTGKGYLLYGWIIFLSLTAIFLNIKAGVLPGFAAFISIFYLLGIKSVFNLKYGLDNIKKLIEASRLTIILHALAGIAMISILWVS